MVVTASPVLLMDDAVQYCQKTPDRRRSMPGWPKPAADADCL
jgi:hypothetical protein